VDYVDFEFFRRSCLNYLIVEKTFFIFFSKFLTNMGPQLTRDFP